MKPTRFVVIAAAAALAGGAGAQTQIYVGDYKFDDPRLHVMGPGGADLEELFIIPRPTGSSSGSKWTPMPGISTGPMARPARAGSAAPTLTGPECSRFSPG
ncbi:MAG: hypothetical protein ACYS0D_06840 [Planctomycetota bacterium]|jgi:hypothetical protein